MSNMEEVLDGEASELYKLLHGIDTDYNKNLMSETIEAEKKRTDNASSIMIELVYLISTYLTHKQDLKNRKTANASFRRIVEMYKILHQTARTKHSLLIRYRGFPNDENADATQDYEIIYGNTSIDSASTAEMMVSLGMTKTTLADHLHEAFQGFYHNKIYSLYLRYRGNHQNEIRRFQDSLQVLAHFHEAAGSDQTLRFQNHGGERPGLPVDTKP